MIGLDTNVLVRYIMQDEPVQSRQVAELIDALTVQSPGFVSLVTLVELCWVLGSSYALDRSRLVEALEALRTRELVIEEAEVAWQSVRRYRDSAADFVNCLIERLGRCCRMPTHAHVRSWRSKALRHGADCGMTARDLTRATSFLAR